MTAPDYDGYTFSSETLNYTAPGTTAGIKLQVQKDGVTFASNQEIKFENNLYSGVSSGSIGLGAVNLTNLATLTSVQTSLFTGSTFVNYAFNYDSTSNFKYFWYPSRFGNRSTAPATTYIGAVSYTNLNGYAENYRVYRTSSSTTATQITINP
jgi:hypothetical protein